MGSWSYLAASRTLDPHYLLDWGLMHDDIQIIMAAKYAIPPLWLGIFQENDLYICTLKYDNGETSSHPVYITPAETGIQRTIERRSMFCRLYSTNIEPTYDKWLEMLQLFNGNYIHLDWSDVANIGDENEAHEMNLGVRTGIRAFESDATNDWQACFRNCNSVFDIKTKLASLNHSPDPIEGNLYGYHFIRSANKKGNLEWKVESSQDLQSKPWWKLW